MAGRSFTTGELARRVGARLVGDAERSILGLAPLHRAGPRDLSHLSSRHWRDHLATTGAGAVLVLEKDVASVPSVALVVADPYLAYATLSRCFESAERLPPGVHPTAVIAASARLGSDARVAAGAVVGEGVTLGDEVDVGAGAVVEYGATIAAGSRILARAVISHDVRIGRGVLIHPGAVIGADGFGFARADDGTAHRIAQLGSVVIEDDVEVGANTTIDRGALEDTIIRRGAKIDNQVQIGHNVEVGPDTIICGCVGIVGSTRIGARCVLAGGVGIGGDGPITVADDVVITGMTHVSRSIKAPGRYSSGTLHGPSISWKRNVLRLAELDRWVRRIVALEHRQGQRGKGF